MYEYATCCSVQLAAAVYDAVERREGRCGSYETVDAVAWQTRAHARTRARVKRLLLLRHACLASWREERTAKLVVQTNYKT
jgi:hypothetical protein